MHDEALCVLPELLDRLGIEAPVLVGHSDGASIALIHAGGSGRPVSGIVAMAPHVYVEDISVAGIAQARRQYQTSDLRARLARHHADVDTAFWGWNDIWLDPPFRAWNIEEYLPGVTCPVLCVQCADDQYGSLDQLDRIARGAAGPVSRVMFSAGGHGPQRSHPAEVAGVIARFVRSVGEVQPCGVGPCPVRSVRSVRPVRGGGVALRGRPLPGSVSPPDAAITRVGRSLHGLTPVPGR